jgi:hypothetical protein
MNNFVQLYTLGEPAPMSSTFTYLLDLGEAWDGYM